MRFFGELSGSPFFFVALCRVFYFQCTENDDTVEVRKEAAFTESSEALVFQIRVVLKINGKCVIP